MSKFKIIRLAILVTAVLSLTACGNVNNEGAEDNGRNMDENRIQTNNVRNQTNNVRNQSTMHNNSRVEMSEQIAEVIADMNEVDTANVMLTDENAYIAVILEDNTDVNITDNLKERIAIQVQSRNPNVNNVYVSTNPDFVDRMNGFVDQVQAGKPIPGLVNEFNTMVNRIFPTNAAND